MVFNDRHSAGLLLVEKLSHLGGSNARILGLARGGVVVACAIGSALDIAADVLIVKKIPAPGQSELAIGALAPDGVSFVDWKFAQMVGADSEYIKKAISDKRQEIREKTLLYRKGMKPYEIKDKKVILVDDGVATGATLQAAVQWARKKQARRIIAAIPVMPEDSVGKIRPEVDELIVLETPQSFGAVGQFYKDFPQIEDAQVIELLGDSKMARQ